MAGGRRLRWGIGALAGAGVLVTHWLTYRIAVPAHEHAEVLHDTGHSSWPVVSALVLALFTAAVLRASTQARRGAPRPSFGLLAGRLVAVQAVLWVVVEVGERLAAGRLASLDDHGVLLIGLGVQVAVALLGAALTCLGHRAVRALATARRRKTAPRATSQPRTRHVDRHAHRLPPLAGAQGLRGPPRTTTPATS